MESNEKRLIDAAWALTRAALDIPVGAALDRANLAKARKTLQANTDAAPESFQMIDALDAYLAESERSGIVPGEYVVGYRSRPEVFKREMHRVSVYEIDGELLWNYVGDSTVHRIPLRHPRRIA